VSGVCLGNNKWNDLKLDFFEGSWENWETKKKCCFCLLSQKGNDFDHIAGYAVLLWVQEKK
jgi:hypothetical protein